MINRVKQWLDSVKKRQPSVHDNSHSQMKDNPYLQSMALWDDIYGSVQQRLENAYRVIFILSAALVAAIIGMVLIASQSKIKPYVAVLRGNEVLTVQEAESSNLDSHKRQLSQVFGKSFIEHLKTVSVDTMVNKKNRLWVYSYATGEAEKVVREFYKKNAPNTLAEHIVKDVDITSVLVPSKHSLDIRWIETSRDARSGVLLNKQHYIAKLTYSFSKPSQNSIILRNNPFGMKITHLSLSRDSNFEN